MEKELEQKVFFEKNYENKNDLENEVNDYILDLRKKSKMGKRIKKIV